ncbi:MAG: DUF1800 domain-containing protein [Acidobacteria bacterium]|nr:MAG: DUF1800 domain-containing protein [Acidobacteriota bacterium]
MNSLISRRFRLVAAAALAVAALAGGERARADKVPAGVPKNPDDRTILHVLNRLGFGARPGDVERVRRIGLDAYIEQQLHPDRIPETTIASRLAQFETLGKSSGELARDYFVPAMEARQRAQRQAAADGQKDAAAASGDDAKRMRTPEQMELQRKERAVLAELSEQKILRAAYSDRQLEEVMTDFWFNHFNVFAGKGPTQVYLTEYERDVIRPRALGRFHDLLDATATSPAMLFYLDNWQSVDPDMEARLAREGLQPRGGFGSPFGRPRMRRPGLFPPQPRAGQPAANAQRPKRGLNENYGRELMELHTLGVDGGYTQHDVVDVARCFTGWTIANPRQGGGFRFEPRMHDAGPKVVLGHKIKAGGGRDDGEQVLDILAKHRATARFISTKLVRRFVSDTPPPSLVSRAAARFQQTDGNIREVLKTIFTSPEFYAADAYRAKVKSPFEFIVSAVRATGADVQNALPLVQTARQLGEPLYMCQPPTGYKDTADAWVNTGALLNRMNFALALASGKMRGVEAAANAAVPAATAESVRTYLVDAVLANDISSATQSTLAKALDPRQAAALVLGSPEFQRR